MAIYTPKPPELLVNPWNIPTALATGLAGSALSTRVGNKWVSLGILAALVAWLTWFLLIRLSNRFIPRRVRQPDLSS
jgi:hypothetical protein